MAEVVDNDVLRIELQHYQDKFIFSKSRYPAIIGGVGTGKTLALLLKAYLFCQDYPNALALIVRREYTDLRDSTIKDFERYFGVKINSDKEYEFPNKSKIMFRHGDMSDINVLKNINLSFIGIEQAEEYESAEIFDFLRDRLRRQTTPYRQMCIIANANGHNWIYDRWIANAKIKKYDLKTGQNDYDCDDYQCWTANSFANEAILPADFIADLRKMEIEAPNHYAQYVMNSFDEKDADDYLFRQAELDACTSLPISTSGNGYVIMGVDLARFGKDLCVASILENSGPYKWNMLAVESWKNADLMYSTGKIIDLAKRYCASQVIVDGDGLGAGVVDRLKESNINVKEFRGGMTANSQEDFINIRSEGYFKLKNLVVNQYIKLTDRTTIGELLNIRYSFDSKGRKRIISKDELRKVGIKSPDYADALMMGITGTNAANLSKPERKRGVIITKSNWDVF